jgi:hypothetical protein
MLLLQYVTFGYLTWPRIAYHPKVENQASHGLPVVGLEQHPGENPAAERPKTPRTRPFPTDGAPDPALATPTGASVAREDTQPEERHE